jgi:D-tyrosyl-tRNA(Tyr) deacylase
MRAVVQRVSHGRVTVSDRETGSIGRGVVVLLGVSTEDGADDASWTAHKVANLRIFNDDEGRMERSLLDVGGEALVVSQFTLYGDVRKGRRPSFIRAARGDEANHLYETVTANLRDLGIAVATGEFGAMMNVELVNDGPVTILLDSKKGS